MPFVLSSPSNNENPAKDLVATLSFRRSVFASDISLLINLLYVYSASELETTKSEVIAFPSWVFIPLALPLFTTISVTKVLNSNLTPRSKHLCSRATESCPMPPLICQAPKVLSTNAIVNKTAGALLGSLPV